jgi:hypothetical protein
MGLGHGVSLTITEKARLPVEETRPPAFYFLRSP